MKKPSYIFLADGFEEIEALSTVDILRRAGIEISTVSITDSLTVRGAHGVSVVADTKLTDIDASSADWLIAPGGMPGSTNLHECKPLCEMLKAHDAKGGNIAAICAAPAFVLAPLGILDNREATGYPGTTGATDRPVKWKDAPVVVSDNVVTGNGPASAMEFALTIVGRATDSAIAQQTGGALLFFKPPTNLYL